MLRLRSLLLVFFYLRAAHLSSVEITDSDRSFLISEGDNFTLTCSLKYILYQGSLIFNQTTQQDIREEIIPRDSSFFWMLPNGQREDVFESAKTQSWPRNRDGTSYIVQHKKEFVNAQKSDEGVYRCYGRAVIRQQSTVGEERQILIYSRNSSDVYHVYVKKPGPGWIFNIRRPTQCVGLGKKAQWVGFLARIYGNETFKVTSWQAFDSIDETLSTDVEKIPRLSEKSAVTYELDGKKTEFGFSELYLTNDQVLMDDPADYLVTVEDDEGRTKTQHLQLIVESKKNDSIVEIAPLAKKFYDVGDFVNITCTMKRVEPHTNRYVLHFAQCEDISDCTIKTAISTSSIIHVYPYGSPCWLGLPAPPPKVRHETVTILNHKVETSGVFYCGRDVFSPSSRMPLIIGKPEIAQ